MMLKNLIRRLILWAVPEIKQLPHVPSMIQLLHEEWHHWNDKAELDELQKRVEHIEDVLDE